MLPWWGSSRHGGYGPLVGVPYTIQYLFEGAKLIPAQPIDLLAERAHSQTNSADLIAVLQHHTDLRALVRRKEIQRVIKFLDRLV